VLSLKLRGRTLRVSARDAVTVRVAVRPGRARTAALKRGRATIALGRLSRGRHRLTVTPLGAHGERGRARTLSFVVRS
jgi:hypothetical protein